MYRDDLAYVHHLGFGDYARRLAPAIVGMLRQRLPQAGKAARPLVVEFGCGGGTLAACLIEQGFPVLGIDQSAAMIRRARRTAPQGRFAVGTLADSRIPECGAIVAIGEVVNYMSRGNIRSTSRHDAQLARFFARAAAALRPGGLLLFDFMASARGRTFAAKGRAGDGWAMVAGASVDGEILTRRITTFRRIRGSFRSRKEIHRVRLFRRSRVEQALRRVGFNVAIRSSIGRVSMMQGDRVAIAERA